MMTSGPETTELDHFELIPKTPHSARKRTPAKPLLYADENMSIVPLPASPTTNLQPQTDFTISQVIPPLLSPKENKKPNVFERLFHVKGDPAASKRSKSAATPRPSAALPPARSKKPLTVPEEFHFRTDQRIAMKRHDQEEPTAKPSVSKQMRKQPTTVKTPKQARTLTVPVSPVFASDKRAAMRKH